ncbi:MAG: TatD family hydrolase [Bacteroidaceae bacterium]|nr:TatD family hydrolase [Bacteroidaceae bacterium]
MSFFDIHTHKQDSVNSSSILNCTSYITDRNISVGLHPWDIGEEWENKICEIKKAASAKNVIAIGECGIDKLKSPADITTQTEVFLQQALLAEEFMKPLIIHCVKGIDDIIAIYKQVNPKQAWIIHGFRGNKQQAEQLVKCGFHLSLGEHHNTESAKFIPDNRLFIESDESKKDIADIYRSIAMAREIPVDELKLLINKNRNRIMQF